jgi:hypothetical protein
MGPQLPGGGAQSDLRQRMAYWQSIKQKGMGVYFNIFQSCLIWKGFDSVLTQQAMRGTTGTWNNPPPPPPRRGGGRLDKARAL